MYAYISIDHIYLYMYKAFIYIYICFILEGTQGVPRSGGRK